MRVATQITTLQLAICKSVSPPVQLCHSPFLQLLAVSRREDVHRMKRPASRAAQAHEAPGDSGEAGEVPEKRMLRVVCLKDGWRVETRKGDELEWLCLDDPCEIAVQHENEKLPFDVRFRLMGTGTVVRNHRARRLSSSLFIE